MISIEKPIIQINNPAIRYISIGVFWVEDIATNPAEKVKKIQTP